MATVSVTNFEQYVGANLFSNENVLLAPEGHTYVARVTFEATDSYAVGGLAADLNVGGGRKIKEAIPVKDPTYDADPHYDIANKKVQLYAAGTEVAANVTTMRGKTVKFLIFAN